MGYGATNIYNISKSILMKEIICTLFADKKNMLSKRAKIWGYSIIDDMYEYKLLQV